MAKYVEKEPTLKEYIEEKISLLEDFCVHLDKRTIVELRALKSKQDVDKFAKKLIYDSFDRRDELERAVAERTLVIKPAKPKIDKASHRQKMYDFYEKYNIPKTIFIELAGTSYNPLRKYENCENVSLTAKLNIEKTIRIIEKHNLVYSKKDKEQYIKTFKKLWKKEK